MRSDASGAVRSVDILGVRVDDVTIPEGQAAVRGFLQAGGSHQIVTPNAEFVMLARRDPEFRSILNSSALSIPDGAGLLLAGRLLGSPLREQVTGTDLAVSLAEMSAAEGYRLYLLGAAEGVAAEAARRLESRFPGLAVAGAYAGTPDLAAESDIQDRIRASGPVDILLVAFGAPAQERWIARNAAGLGIGVSMGVGGVFDFVAGRVPRAPAWMRRAGFDWLFRLAVQPWRWRRQLALPQFVILVLVEAVRRRLGRIGRTGGVQWPD